jgi:cobalamin biosynthetic protein CobC
MSSVSPLCPKNDAPPHGGDLGAARRLFPEAPEPFVDLSTGINPEPYPVPAVPPSALARLPEPAEVEALAAAAAAAYGAPSSGHVVPAPGTQILLPMVAGLVPPGRAMIVAPSYSEHARSAKLAGHDVTEIRTLEAGASADLVIVTNPNNPDGRLRPASELRAFAQALRARGGLLVIDEAFMDVAPGEMSLAPETIGDNVVVLRSFGKFFGLAGLRLGFAIAAPQRAARIRAQLGPWAVSGPAITIGRTALADRIWIERMRFKLAERARELDALLIAAGLEIVGGTTLFRLAHAPNAAGLFTHLGRAGLLVRVFRDYPQWVRFGLPATEAQWQRLECALAAWRTACGTSAS